MENHNKPSMHHIIRARKTTFGRAVLTQARASLYLHSNDSNQSKGAIGTVEPVWPLLYRKKKVSINNLLANVITEDPIPVMHTSSFGHSMKKIIFCRKSWFSIMRVLANECRQSPMVSFYDNSSYLITIFKLTTARVTG